MTQILFDLEPLEAFRERHRRQLADPGARRRLADPHVRAADPACTTRRRGSSCPSTCRSGIASAGAEARRVGGELGLELIEARARARGGRRTSSRRSAQPLNVVDFLPQPEAQRAGRDRPPERATARAAPGRPGCRSRRRHADPRGEDRRLRRDPARSIAGPPELPCRTRPASAVIVRVTRAVAVRVLRQHDGVRPIRPAVDGERAVLAGSRRSRRRAVDRLARSAAARRLAPRRAARRRRSCGRRRRRARGEQPRSPGICTRRVAFTGDDVRGGDDEVAAREPAAALDADAAGAAERRLTTRRAPHARITGSRRTLAIGGVAGAAGPAIDGNGSMRASSSRTLPRRHRARRAGGRSPSAAPRAGAASGRGRAARRAARPRRTRGRSRAPKTRPPSESSSAERRQPQPAADERAGERARRPAGARRRRARRRAPATGVHGESAPPSSRCGATREPT